MCVCVCVLLHIGQRAFGRHTHTNSLYLSLSHIDTHTSTRGSVQLIETDSESAHARECCISERITESEALARASRPPHPLFHVRTSLALFVQIRWHEKYLGLEFFLSRHKALIKQD